MTKFRVSVDTRDEDTLFTHKKISLGSKTIETPIKSLSIGKSRQSKEVLSEDARGFNEIYFQADSERLEEARQEFKSGLKSKIRSALKKTNRNEEFVVVFCEFNSVEEFSREHLEYLADLLYSTSDFLAVPLMPAILEAIKDDKRGTASIYFDWYLNNVRNFIRVAREWNDKPLMGTIPSLPRAFTDKIIEEYINEGLRAFCFNFNGRTVTAESQLTDMVAPLMRNITVQNMEEDVFLYSLNAHRGRSTQEGDYIPARDFMSFGFGLDVLGDKHTGGSLPPHLFEKLEDSDPTFRLFERDDYIYRNYEYGPELESRLPDDSGLSKSRIMSRPSDNYRLATLLNGEQQAKEANSLRTVIDENRVSDHVAVKEGVGDDELQSMKDTKENFEGNQAQTSLSNLDNMLG